MAATTRTSELLEELETIDRREDRILDALLQHGTRLEHHLDETERRKRVVTVGDLRALTDALATVETAIADVQARIARASAVPPPGNGAVQHATFDALAASLRAQDAEADRLRALLRERLLALKEQAGEGVAGGHADPAAPDGARPRTFRITDPRMRGVDVRAFQRRLNLRLKAWGVRRRIAENGTYGPETRKAARQVAYGLGIAAADYKHGITPAVRSVIRTPSRRTPQQLERARQRRDWVRKLGGHRVTTTRPDAAGGGTVAAAIRAGGGRYEKVIVREAKRSGLSASLVCAVIEQETHFRNVFGHDGGPRHTNPVKSPPGGLLVVTEERYKRYLKHRNLHRGQQGVGPMQLTSADLQDRADRLGGCWRVGPNIRVGCEYLAEKIKARGLQAGVQAYNGAPGDKYAKSVLARERVWRSRLEAVRPVGAKDPSHGAPRTFRLSTPRMSGRDVKAFQQELNDRFDAWGVHKQLAENGIYDAVTRTAARQVARGLGVAAADYERGITPELRSLIRTPSRRTPQQLRRARQQRAWLGKLRKHHAKRGRRGGALRLRAHREARKLVGVMETGGNNRGKTVLAIIKANGGPGPEPWCGDFVAWCYRKAGSKSVTRAWAAVRQYLPLTGLKGTKEPLKGDIVRFTFDHIGLFVCWCDARGNEVAKARATHIRTIEGNTGRSGAVSDSKTGGDGVYVKLRSRSLVRDFIHVLR